MRNAVSIVADLCHIGGVGVGGTPVPLLPWATMLIPNCCLRQPYRCLGQLEREILTISIALGLENVFRQLLLPFPLPDTNVTLSLRQVAGGRKACFNFYMPKLPQHATPSEARALSPEARALWNATRPPSDRLPEEDDYCPAVVKKGPRAGQRCIKMRGFGTDHPGVGYCTGHGGNTQAGKKHAARLMGRRILAEMKFGGDRDLPEIMNITAEEALLEEVRRSSAMVRFLEEKIGAWQNDEADQAPGLGLPRLVEETSKGAPGATDAQVWLLLYREERKHLAQVSKMCIDAKISHRLVNLAEAQGAIIKTIIKNVLEQLGLSEVQISMVPTVVAAAIARGQVEFRRRDLPKDAFEPVKQVTDGRS